jgi:hypothetical protein
MQQLKLRLLFGVCSLLILVSCGGKGPKVTVCLLDSANQTLECSNADGQAFTLPLNSAENYVCLSPGDTQKIVDYAKAKCQ